LHGGDAQGELPRKQERDEDEEIDEYEGMDKPEDKDERNLSQEEHRMEEGDPRDQLQRNGKGFEKGKIKEEEKPGIRRVLISIKAEMNQEELTIEGQWQTMKEGDDGLTKQKGRETKRKVQHLRSQADEKVK
jgi:hypothetical protein